MSEEQNGIKPDQYIIADATDPYIKADADGVVYKHGGIVPHDPNRKPFHFDNALVVPREQFEKHLDQLKDLGSIQKQRMLYGLWDRDLKAKAVHDIWAHWMRYMFATLPQLDLHSGRVSVIPFELAERWKRQMRTDFFALSRREQESDYEVADRYLDPFELKKTEVKAHEKAQSSNPSEFQTGELIKFDDLGYHVIVKPVNEVIYEFTLFQVTLQPDGSYVYYNDTNGQPEFADSIHQAGWFANGTIKFDGCSHWEFYDQKDSAIHFCGKSDFQQAMFVMSECWTLAKERIKNRMGD